MPVITFASTKGGVGKTTLALAVAADLVLDGASVTLLDADPNGHAATGATQFALPGLKVLPVSEDTIMDAIQNERKTADMVVTDLPGFGANILTYGISRSNLVIVPTQPSSMDLRDALKTLTMVHKVEQVVERTVPCRFILTRMPVLASRAAAHSRRELEAKGIPLMKTELLERTAFRDMTFTGVVPRLVEANGNAARNVQAITQEILGTLAGLARKEVA
jgi:chromosome partitioning protein